MTHITVPANRLYFALLDQPVSRGRGRAEELGFAFEAALPVELDSVHALYRPLSDGRVLAIGLDSTAAAELGWSNTIATPAGWPEWIRPEIRDIPPESVNLLTGNATPKSVRQARFTTVNRTLWVLSLVAIIASIGLERRVRSTNMAVGALDRQLQLAYADALGPAKANSGQPAAAILTSELRRLRATRTALPTEQRNSADRVLAGLLDAWPQIPTKTESITIAERSVEVVVRVENLGGVQQLVTAFAEVDGIAPATTSTEAQQEEVRATIRLDREVQP
jgi:hypothetical protein